MTPMRTRAAALGVALALALTWVVLVGPDRVGRAATPTGTTTLTSTTNGGATARAGGDQSQLSGDGRYDVFTSPGALDPNGVGDCGNGVCGPQVYVRDLVAGRTDIVSVGTSDTARPGAGTVQQPRGDSFYPTISSNGRLVAFVTDSSNVAADVPGEGEGAVMLCDRGAPDSDHRYRVVPAPGKTYPSTLRCYEVGTAEIGSDYRPRLAGDGRQLVWGDGEQVRALSLEVDPSTEALLAAPRLRKPDLRSFGGAGDGPPGTGPQDDVVYDQPDVAYFGQWLIMTGTVYAGDDDEDQPYTEIVLVNLDEATPTLQRVDVRQDSGDSAGFFGDETTVGHPAVDGSGFGIAYDVGDDPYDPDNAPRVYYSTIIGRQGELDSPASSGVLVSTRYADGKADGPGDGAFPAFSSDGRYLGFISDDPGVWRGKAGTTVATSCLNEGEGIAARPAATLSGSPSDTPSDTPSDPVSGSSSSGPGFARSACQAVVRDLGDDTYDSVRPGPAELASPSTGTTCPGATAADVCPGNGETVGPLSLTSGGEAVGFTSSATDLARAANGRSQTYVRRWTPRLVVDPDPIDFGRVQQNHLVAKEYTLSTSGFGPLPIGASTVTGPNRAEFANYFCSGTIYVGDPCYGQVYFRPAGTGTRTATLTIMSEPPDDAVAPRTLITVPLTGTGSGRPPDVAQFANSPRTLDFGSAIPLKTGGTKRTLTLSDPGGAALGVNSITVTAGNGAAADYAVGTSSCAGGHAPTSSSPPPTSSSPPGDESSSEGPPIPSASDSSTPATPGKLFTIPAGGHCTVTITWTGRAVGSRNATLVIAMNAPVGTFHLPMVARVPRPELQVNPTVLVAGRVTAVSGEGFAPKATVDVSSPFSQDVLVTTSKTGTFTTDLLVLSDATAGPRDVSATMPALDPSITATTPLLIVLGSQQGPVLVDRH